MADKNCYDHFKDDKTHDCEKCPVFKAKVGSTCYMSTGTRCFGKEQGSYIEKIDFCRQCPFYLITMGKSF